MNYLIKKTIKPICLDSGWESREWDGVNLAVIANFRPEIVETQIWHLGFYIPFSIFKKYFDIPAKLSGQEWRGNLYKCGDKTSHPHWGSWSPILEMNFHRPSDFGVLTFE